MIVSRRQFVAGSAVLALVPARTFAAVDENRLRMIAHRELTRNQSTIWLRDTVGIADFSRPSNEPRFFVVDMIGGQIRPFLVAHGRGSDPEHEGVVRRFSNEFESLASSRGSFLTLTWYDGIHGPSMRLYGLEPDISNAEARAIVVHGAWYANPDMIEKWGKLGRSDGCFAFPQDDLMQIIARVGPGRPIFSGKLSEA